MSLGSCLVPLSAKRRTGGGGEMNDGSQGHWGLWAGRKAVSAINNLFLGAMQEGVVMATLA